MKKLQTHAEMTKIVEDFLMERPHYSSTFISEHLRGVTHNTVTVIRTRMEVTHQIPYLEKFLGGDGRWRERRNINAPLSHDRYFCDD